MTLILISRGGRRGDVRGSNVTATALEDQVSLPAPSIQTDTRVHTMGYVHVHVLKFQTLGMKSNKAFGGREMRFAERSSQRDV